MSKTGKLLCVAQMIKTYTLLLAKLYPQKNGTYAHWLRLQELRYGRQRSAMLGLHPQSVPVETVFVDKEIQMVLVECPSGHYQAFYKNVSK